MDIIKELEELENRLRRGEDVRKDFWRVVGRIKRLERVDDEVVVKAAEIRNALFGRKVILSHKKGFVLFSSLFVLFNVLFFVLINETFSWLLKTILLLFIEALVLYTSFLVGRGLGSALTGIRMEGFYKYNPLEFGVKIDYESYLRASQSRRFMLFFVPVAFENLVMLIQAFALVLMEVGYWIIPLAFIFANVLFSYLVHRIKKTGELHRMLRELRILMELREKKLCAR